MKKEYYERYKEHLNEVGINRSVFRYYEQLMDDLFASVLKTKDEFEINKFNLNLINKESVQDYLDNFIGSSRTKNKIIFAFTHFIKSMNKNEMCPKIPEFELEEYDLKGRRVATTYFTHDEIINFCYKIEDLVIALAVLITYEGSLRRAEVCNLNLDDYDRKTGILIGDGREIQLTENTAKLLNRYISLNVDAYEKWQNECIEPLALFCNNRTSRISTTSLSRKLKLSVYQYLESEFVTDLKENERYTTHFTFDEIKDSRKLYLAHLGYSAEQICEMYNIANIQDVRSVIRHLKEYY